MSCTGRNFDIQNGGRSAKTLCTDSQGIDAIINLDSELFQLARRAPLQELQHVQWPHESLLGEQHRLLAATTNANSNTAGRAPAGAKSLNCANHPIGDRTRRVQYDKFRFIL